MDLSTGSLSRLDVIKTKPRAGPPSRRLINCFVRDTSLFKRNWASVSLPLSPSLSPPLDHPAHPAHPSDSYLFVQRVRTGVFHRRARCSATAPRISQSEGKIRFGPPCPPDGRSRGKKKRGGNSTVAGVNEKVDRPFCTKSTRPTWRSDFLRATFPSLASIIDFARRGDSRDEKVLRNISMIFQYLRHKNMIFLL